MDQLPLWENPVSKTVATPSLGEAPPKLNKLAQRCLQSAASLQKASEAKHRSATNMLALPPTRKRLLDGASLRREAIRLERMQLMFQWLAELHCQGTVPAGLEQITTVAALERALFGRESIDAAQALFNSLPGQGLKEHRLQELIQQAALMKIAGYVPTPAHIADVVVRSAQIKPSHLVLDPSAGTGNLIDAVLRVHPNANVSYCELNCFLLDILQQKYEGQDDIHFAGRDCLEISADRKFDRIVVNPPFEGGQDVEHVLYLHSLLKPKGRMVAILPDGTFHRKDKKSVSFQDLLAARGGVVQELDSSTFKGSGVMVFSRVVFLNA